MRARKIVLLMTGVTFFRSHSKPHWAAPYVHGVRMPVITLPGIISLRMAVHAARVAQHGNKCSEQRSVAAGVGCSNFFLGWRFRCGYRTRKPQRSGDAEHDQARQRRLKYEMQALHTASVRRMGNRRIRFPVTANTAFAMAGAAHGTPGSPIPPAFSLLSTM